MSDYMALRSRKINVWLRCPFEGGWEGRWLGQGKE